MMDESYQHIDIAKAYDRARALRSAYIRQFFANLFSRPKTAVNDEIVIPGGHAVA